MNSVSKGADARARDGGTDEHSDVWTAIDDQRRVLVQLLEVLPEEEWRRPSLCEGWTVRQVAAHLALQNTAVLKIIDNLDLLCLLSMASTPPVFRSPLRAVI